MKPFRMKSVARGLAALAVVWTAPLLAPAESSAQETETVESQRVVVEVRDGKVFVNGEETEVGESGRIVLRKSDGDHVVVITEKDGPAWFSTMGLGERAREHAEQARQMALRQFRMALPDGERAFVWEGDLPDPEDFDIDVDVDLEDRLGDTFVMADGLRGELLRLRGQSEELRKIESEIRAKAREARRADEDERAALESELNALLGEAFSLKLEQERKEVTELEHRLQQLTERLSEREARRQEVLERRRKELLGRKDNLDW